MDYFRTSIKHLPIRSMGSPDGLGEYFAQNGLGAYFQNQYTQPISRDPGGTNTIAAYQEIKGLGCAQCTMKAGPGIGELPAFLSKTWVKVGLGLGVVAIGWYALGSGKKHATNGRRHRRNHKIPLRTA